MNIIKKCIWRVFNCALRGYHYKLVDRDFFFDGKRKIAYCEVCGMRLIISGLSNKRYEEREDRD